jgi:uroporphyrinogen-III decarboxylase
MTSRERMKTIMNFGIPDRVGMHDWFWGATIARWREEGLPEDADFGKRFGFDIGQIAYDQSFRFEREVLEEDDETQIERNDFGMTQRRWKGKQGAPEQLDCLIKTRADWEKHKDRFLPSADRFADDIAQRLEKLHEKGGYATYWYLEPFELAWRFLGFKETLMMMAADPEFMSDLFEACADQIIGTHEAVAAKGAVFDGNWAGGDIACKTGPLFSPKMYREMLMPHHKRIFSYFNDRGMPTLYHGDGDCRPVLEDLIEAGVRALHPLECKAGMDVRDLKPKVHGRLVLFGNIDVRELSKTREDVEREIRSKVPVAMEGGGYIYCVDHSVASTVSLENYEYALSLVREVGTY